MVSEAVALARLRYRLPAWSEGYFEVLEDGTVAAMLPRADADGSIAAPLPEVASAALAGGLGLPLMVRFPSMLSDRLRRLQNAFADAMDASGKRQQYLPVYPVKANQQRVVVETMVRSSPECGLEVGSKAEFMLALALATERNTIVCNGCKDHDLLQLALMCGNLGIKVFIVVESLDELQHVLRLATHMKARPLLGLRLRLRSVAKGNWQSTGGHRSKFGLTPEALLRAVSMLRRAGMLDCLKLLHFHIGSQVPELEAFSGAITEACRYYVDMHGMGAQLQYLDVGGGLAVDYDGTASAGPCSASYGMDQYAAAVVSGVQSVCGAANVALPTIMTECGRAMTAHHAVVIASVAGIEATRPGVASAPELEQCGAELRQLAKEVELMPDDPPQALALLEQVERRWQLVGDMFKDGKAGLRCLAAADQVYYAACAGAAKVMERAGEPAPAVAAQLTSARLLCNFSVFQTLPDAWALDQVFPIMPLQGLDREDQCLVTVHDLTCDSDGRVTSYVHDGGSRDAMPMPVLDDGEPPLMGFFMVGAYQEVLGDVHNLFGNESSVTVVADGDGYKLVDFLGGDTVASLLSTVQCDPQWLLQECARKIASAGMAGADHDRYMQKLHRILYGYTYMNTPSFPRHLDSGQN